jgi:hypothetical protein
MKPIKTVLLLLLTVAPALLVAQKKIAECTIVYDIQVQTDSKEPQLADMFNGATNTVYLKGPQSRSEMISSLGVQSTILDTRTGAERIW